MGGGIFTRGTETSAKLKLDFLWLKSSTSSVRGRRRGLGIGLGFELEREVVLEARLRVGFSRLSGNTSVEARAFTCG